MVVSAMQVRKGDKLFGFNTTLEGESLREMVCKEIGRLPADLVLDEARFASELDLPMVATFDTLGRSRTVHVSVEVEGNDSEPEGVRQVVAKVMRIDVNR